MDQRLRVVTETPTDIAHRILREAQAAAPHIDNAQLLDYLQQISGRHLAINAALGEIQQHMKELSELMCFVSLTVLHRETHETTMT